MLFHRLNAVIVTIVTFFVMKADASDSLPEITVLGNKFFFSNNGSQFFMRGVAYQTDSTGVEGTQTFKDPLGDYDVCSRDIPYLQKLRTNVIRVYALDTALDHSKCMQALADAGIYLIADLSEPGLSINRKSPQWDLDLYKRYTSVVDALANYTNVLGFFAGNEVTNDDTNTGASAFVKAAIRDMKSYIKSKGYRNIPVGYSSNDDAATREAITDYFACGSDAEKADFYGINMYEWCGESTFEKSGYADRTKEFSRVDIPVFFSEYGCNEIRPRKFTEVEALYGDDMTDVWSGGIVYMYFEEANNYGLVSIDSNDKVSTLADFNYYSNQIQTVNPTGVNSAYYTPSSKSINCPTPAAHWKAVSKLPPTPDENVCSCMVESLSCVVSDNIKEDDYENLFAYVCSQISCDGIHADATTGDYGAYSFCSSKEKLSFILDAFYKVSGSSPNGCSFGGSASLHKPSTESTCTAILNAIGTAGTGSFRAQITYATVANRPKASNPSSLDSTSENSATNSSSSSNSSNTSKSSNAAIINTNPSLPPVFASLAVSLSFLLGFSLVIA
ncbi:uncharacterized protein Ecym_5666 [Eremothecium cymbalariae DBVPG|uniref:1,3-beta-glucanosyltransferase n=1 Tax=Eremothecium cymbalariae (strain CBS 270.75 / DBVPG 7215 / KCTC 17166 / NRRL Y-17582) TaxID=931890 RepID=I6NEA7_ERECY|nr:hypothetical protein Ecym_5666 [Eremothecium cymbalariae DBVPG\